MVSGFDHRQAADARTDDASNTNRFLVTELLAGGQPRIGYSLHSRSNSEMDESVHRPGFLGPEIDFHVKAFHLACKLAGKTGRVKPGDAIYTRLASQQTGPRVGHRIANGADAAQTSYDDTTTGHQAFWCVLA